MNLHIPENYSGVIPGREKNPRIAGVSSPVEKKILLLSKNWKPHAPEHEIQNKGYETSACLDFSGSDCLEYLFNFYKENNKFSPELLKWFNDKGYIVNGKFNFSDRLAANYSDIIPLSGTYQYKANDALCKYLIPESMLPYTTIGKYENPDTTPGGYFNRNAITQEMLDLAKEFNKRITVDWYYEENPTTGLFSSPLQCIGRYADGDCILKPEGAWNHGLCIPNEEEDYFDIDDSYTVQFKKYGKNYVGSFVGYSITINDITMNIQEFLTTNDLKWVQNETTGQFARIMQKKLRPINSKDRGALILLDEKVRSNKIVKDNKEIPAKITNAEWELLPKDDF